MTIKTKAKIEVLSDVMAGLGLLLIFVVILITGGGKAEKANADLANTETLPAIAQDISATLKGLINSSDKPVTARGFEWGTSPSYGNSAPLNGASLPVKFNSQWPSAFAPDSIAVKNDGGYAILSTQLNKVLVFDVLGNQIAELGGTQGLGNYEFNSPRALAYDSSGDLYIADTQNSRIQKYSLNLAYSQTISDPAIQKPTALQIDSANNLYVLDEAMQKVFKLDNSFNIVATIGEGVLNQPSSMAIDQSGNVFVSQLDGAKKFDSFGNYIQTFGSELYDSVAIGASGEIYSLKDDYIKIYSNDGQFLNQFGGNGNAIAQFNNAKALNINNNNLFVADTDNLRVQKFINQASLPLGNFEQNISGLNCSTTYHFRAYATNEDGTSYGNDQSFNTLPCGVSAQALTIQTNDPTGVGSFTATLNGEVTASTSAITRRGFEWGTSASFGNYIAGIAAESSRKLYPDTTGWPTASNLPTGIAVDSNSQKVYVSDPAGNQIRVFNFSGALIGTYNPGTLSGPNGLAVDNAGRIYIADSGNDRILVVNSDLSTVAGSMGGPGVNPENLNNPNGVALDTFGNVYVADSGNDKIKRYDTSFSYDASGSFGSTGGGSTGQFNNPLGIAIDQTGSNKIVVADTGNNRYQVFEQTYSAGPPISITPISTPSLIVDGSVSGTPFNSPSSVAIDVNNNVYVADTGNHLIGIYNSSGAHLSSYGSIANFNSPFGVATYTEPSSNPVNNNSMVFVTDQNNSEVEKFLTQVEFSVTNYSNTLDYLSCGTTYYYRATATNADGNYLGSTKSFTTNPCNTNVTAATLPPTNISGTFGTLNGNITSVGPDPLLVIQGFEWGSSTAYGNLLNNQNGGSQNDANYLDLATQWSSTLNTPLDIASDEYGNVYVSDYANNKVKKYNNNGGLVTSWNVNQPKGITSRPGTIWVVSSAGISKFQSDGTFLADFSAGIGATDVAADIAGNMFATFPEGFVLKMDSAGNPLDIWGYYSLDTNQNLGYFPTGIEVKDYGSGNGVIYVADTTKNRIAKYSFPNGNFGGSIGSFGSEKGNLILPGFISLNQTNEDVFVTDSTGSVSKFNAVGTQTYYKSNVVNLSYGSALSSILSGVAVDPNGNLFVTSTTDNLVKKFYQRNAAAPFGDYSRVLGQLNCGSTYYYRAFASNGTTNYFGSGQTLKTTDCNLIPTISNPIPFGSIPIGIFTNPQTTGAASAIGPDGQIITPGGGRTGGIVSAIDSALQGILNITKRVPREVAEAIPFLLILLILFFALIYAVQSYRELKSAERYNTLIEKYNNLQFGSKNFISLTNHYLNTPISIMQLSADLLVTNGIIDKAKSQQITEIIHGITDSVHQLLEKNTKTTERFISEISPELLQKKVQKASFNPLAWIPIIIAGGLVLIANLLFLRADVFQFSFTSLIVQVGLFILSALFIILAWRSLNRNREISRQRIVTLQKEKELSEYKINFINEASKSIDKNIDKLKAISNELSNKEEAKAFIRGVGMLSSVQKSFELLKKFSAFSPTGAIDEDDVNLVLNKILERQSDIMARKNIKIKINVAKELIMRLDKSALILLLGSTINNAVKFSKNNSTIFVSIENKFGGTKISVKDQGIGIPKDKIDQLMMPFTRASDAMQYDYEGLGIGLYLDRIIIEQVGGSIKISSELGKGTMIEFNVPRAVNKHESEITSPVRPKQSPATT